MLATERPAVSLSEPGIELVDEETFAARGPSGTLGFIQRVGNIFVALEGEHLSRAIEVGQSLSWDEALAMIVRAHRAHTTA